ncbi:hypothetical protein BJ878DRAFT_497554 [Calycina marina]|uniref:Uncharacterized protein n=1 Tax=Calycina marina TaxID=1763456 RepID=A0A9P8CH20_9HELO|nr:hypothetical protein BJ878DRAFT_497554 [Calycina marina]
MSRRILRPQANICQICNFLVHRAAVRSLPRCTTLYARTISTSRTFKAQKSTSTSARNQIAPIIPKAAPQSASAAPNPGNSQLSQLDLERCWDEVKTNCDALIALERAPTEVETVSALRQCASLVDILIFGLSKPPPKITDGAVSALLTVDNSAGANIPASKPPATAERTMEDLSELALKIVRHPPVFITPNVLSAYVGVQANLGKPQSFPEVFHLYNHKLLPTENTFPVKYQQQNPNKIANAVSSTVADRALQSAIDTKQLVCAMDIVESTYTTTAYLRAKFVRKCLLPATGVVAAPIAAYILASQLALWQKSMDLAMATNVAFAGIISYIFFTGTIGVVAVTTANDNMDRVTWAPGTPLRDRYMREEERAAIDRIAGSWGFRENWRRGEEEGDDWDALREWIGNKGMILDRVELMEGME